MTPVALHSSSFEYSQINALPYHNLPLDVYIASKLSTQSFLVSTPRLIKWVLNECIASPRCRLNIMSATYEPTTTRSCPLLGFHPLRSLRLLLKIQGSSSSNSAEFEPTRYVNDDKTFPGSEFNDEVELLHRLDFVDEEEDEEQFLDSKNPDSFTTASFATGPSYLSVGPCEVRRSRRPALTADTEHTS
jgi:hypothetical protein